MIRMPATNEHTKKQNGFTLVELAIALMVIGLLIGGVLKGQELIENARMTSLMRQFKDYDTAVMIFRNTYNALPGDIRTPDRRIPNCSDEQCAATGNGNGRFEDYNNSSERVNFWIHMERAGLISGLNTSYDGNVSQTFRRISPLTPWGGNMAIKYKSNSQLSGTVQQPDKHYYYPNSTSHADSVPLPIAVMLDMKMDDGKPYTGTVRVDGGTYGNICYDADEDNAYLTDTTLRCHILVEAASTN